MNTHTFTTNDYNTLKSALLDLGKPEYERVRADLIDRLGYEQFRELQNEVFKKIGTIAFDEN
jgi:hypothetical protein